MAASEAAASLPCDSEGPGARGRSTVTTAVATTCALLAVAAGAWMLWWPVPVDMYGWPALVTALVLMVCVQSRRLLERHDTVVEESLLVIGEVGVQLRTIYAGGHTRTQFIDRARIQEVVVHEAITRWQVKYYLAIVLKPAVTLQSTRIAQPRGREASDEGDARLLSSLKQSTTLNDSRLQASTTISPKVTDASEGFDALEHAHPLKPQSSMPAVPTTTLNGGKRRRHIQHRYQPTMAVVFDNLRPRLDLLLTVRDGLAAMLPE